jgi:hypothetical protein
MQNLTVHFELTVVNLEVFWCRCLPQMKENRKWYPSGTIPFTLLPWRILLSTVQNATPNSMPPAALPTVNITERRVP